MKNFLGGMGLGMIANQLADLRLGELLDTPPPGLDEAVAIAKVCESELQPSGRTKALSWLLAACLQTPLHSVKLGAPDCIAPLTLEATTLSLHAGGASHEDERSRLLPGRTILSAC